jgi:hypothetical protein
MRRFFRHEGECGAMKKTVFKALGVLFLAAALGARCEAASLVIEYGGGGMKEAIAASLKKEGAGAGDVTELEVRAAELSFEDCRAIVDTFGSLKKLELSGPGTIPNAIEGYEKGAFGYWDTLEAVVLGEVWQVGYAAFNSCPNLRSVDMPKAERIEDWAFDKCASLEAADMPAIWFIGWGAFSSCAALKSVNMPRATFVGGQSFNGCVSLETVVVNKSAQVAGDAFNGCVKLEDGGITRVTPEDDDDESEEEAFDADEEDAGQ